MTTRVVSVDMIVAVEVDEAAFDEEFMKGFRESMYFFQTLDQHVEHLAQLYARGLVDNGDFIEGYGPSHAMGIKFSRVSQSEEIIERMVT